MLKMPKEEQKLIGELFMDTLEWLHVRYDSPVDPAPLLEKLQAVAWIYTMETIKNGHSKDHTHMIIGMKKIPTTPTVNKYIDDIHPTEPKMPNRGTSKVRTTHMKAIAYILKNPDEIKTHGIDPAVVDTLKQIAYKKFDKAQYEKEKFQNEYMYYDNRISLERFSKKYAELNDKYLVDKSDPQIKSYLRKHVLHKYPKYRDARAEALANQVMDELRYEN